MTSKKMFVQLGENDYAVSTRDILGTSRTLPMGSYRATWHAMFKELTFTKQPITHDKIIELPSPEVERTLHEIRTFIKPETKAKFKKDGLVYKHSFFFHGRPGTGKTYLINKIAELVKEKAVIIYGSTVDTVEEVNKFLGETQTDDLVIYVFEEFDRMLEDGYEEELLSLLDSSVQRDNTIFVATSNYFDKVPKRIIRPGRFASVVEIKEPNADARAAYIVHRLKDTVKVGEWVEKSAGLTIDELKSVIDSVYFYGNNLDASIALVKETRE